MKKLCFIAFLYFLFVLAEPALSGNFLDQLQQAIPKAITNKNSSQKQQTQSYPYHENKSERLTDKSSIKEAQYLLNRLGYKVGDIDGVYGQETTMAIISFQKCKGIYPSGYVTQDLLDVLSKETAKSRPVSGSQELAKAQKDDRTTATITGGVVGGVLGTVLSDKIGVSKAEGATGGAVIGGMTGKVVGDNIAERRGDYAKDYDGVNTEIEAIDKKIAQLKYDIHTLDSNATKRALQIVKMKERAKRGEQVASEAKHLLNRINEEIALQDKLRKNARIELKMIDQDIKTVQEQMHYESDNIKGLEQQRDALLERRDNLIVSLDNLNGITPKLEEQKKTVSGLSLG